MYQDIQIMLGVAGFVSVAIVGASFMPPLTTGGGSSPTGVNQEIFDRTVRLERSFCEEQVSRTNCVCFANKSSVVLTAEQPRVPGLIYPERKTLARLQARQSC